MMYSYKSDIPKMTNLTQRSWVFTTLVTLCMKITFQNRKYSTYWVYRGSSRKSLMVNGF